MSDGGLINFDGEPIGIPRPKDVTEYQARLALNIVAEHVRQQREPTLLYEPRPAALQFHKSKAKIRIIRGPNRSGKTTCGALEVGMAVLGRHPYRKYPKIGTAILVGKDEGHIANPMWTKLSMENPEFRMIRDLETGHFRAYRPWTDEERKEDSVPMPPVIPERAIKGRVVWRDAGVRAPQRVNLKNGWTLLFYTAGGSARPPRGLTADLVWFDEEIPQAEFFDECMMRLLDRQGCFFWSATPQMAGPKMWDLHIEGMKLLERGIEHPHIEEFFVGLEDNPYIAETEKTLIRDVFKNDETQYRVRVLGEYLMSTALTYPMFSQSRHVIPAFDIPPNWCRYAVIDPGFSVCAVVFFATPPEQDRVVVYDELYIRQCTSMELAKRMRHLTMGKRFQAFIIDYHGSIRTEAGGETIGEQYQKEFARLGVKSVATGHGFVPSRGKPEQGVHKVRDWLLPKEETGKPHIQIFSHCYSLVRDMESLHNKIVKGVPQDEPDEQSKHAAAALRYGVMHGLKYVKPPKKQSKKRRLLALLEFHRKPKRRRGISLAAGVAK